MLGIFDLFSNLVRRQALAIVVATLLLFFIAAELSQEVEYAQGFDTYFSKEHKEYKQYKLYSKDFGGSVAPVYIFIKGEDVVNYDVFEYMLELGDALSGIDGVGEVKSPAHSIVKRLGYLPQDETLLKQYAYAYAQFYIPKKSFALMELEITAQNDKYDFIAQEIERKIQIMPKPAGVIVEATGNPMVWYQVNQSISGSMKTMGFAAIIFMVAILVVVFRGVVGRKRFLLLPLILSIFTAVMTFGLMPLVGIPLTEVTNAFFPVLIGLSIEYAAQFQSRFEEEIRKGFKPVDAASNAIKSVGVVLSLAMVTTVIGFLSMVFSGVPSLSWFGMLSAIGLVIAYLLSLTFLPSLLVLLERGERKAETAKEGRDVTGKLLSITAKTTAKHPGTILLIMLVLVISGFYGYNNVGLQTDFYKYIPQDLPAIRKMNEPQSLVGGQDRIIVVIEADKVDADFLKKVDELSNYIVSSEPQILGYSSITTIMKMYNNGELPDNQLEASMLLERIPEESKQRYLSGNMIAIYFTVAPMDWLEFKDLYDRVNEEIRFFGLDQGYYLTGDVVLEMFVADLIVNGQNKMTLASFALVFVVLLVVYRSVVKAAVPLLPITTVIALVGGIMYLLGIERTLVSASLNSLTIGLGIDFSIHVMERYLEERKNGRMPEEAVEVTVENIGKAIMTSGLTMAGGFAAMMVSPFPIMSDFGFVSVIAILFSLISALTIVPAFLIYTERYTMKKRTVSDATISVDGSNSL